MPNLVVAHDDGTIRWLDPLTRRSVVLGGGPTDVRRHTAPVISADGLHVAWSVIGGEGALDASLAIASTSGSDVREIPLVFPAFYLQWRPDGGAVACLGNGPLGLELTAVDVSTGATDIVERGAPLFFDWSGTGVLCVHTGSHGSDRVHALGPGGVAWSMPETPGVFTTPAWLPDGRRIVVATGTDGVVVVDTVDATMQRVAAVDGPARFTVDPWGERVGVVGATGHDGLVLFDLLTGAVEPVTTQPPIAWWWSAFGDRLLVLVAGMVAGSPWLRHLVWHAGDWEHEGQWHRPSTTTAREVLPFPEQYERSHSPWSPAGDAYAYEGVAIDGAAGVWVQHLDQPLPEFHGPGAVVWWS